MHVFTHTLPFHIAGHMEEASEKKRKDRSRGNGVQMSHFLFQYAISYLLSWGFLNFILVSRTTSPTPDSVVTLNLYFWKSSVAVMNDNEIQWYCVIESLKPEVNCTRTHLGFE